MSLRVWIGFGAGKQEMIVSGYVVDNEGNFYYNFRHHRSSPGDMMVLG